MTRLPGPGDSFAEEALALIRSRSSLEPRVALVLGSGLGDAVAGDVREEREFAYHELSGFPPPSVPGHAGRLVLGELYGVAVAVFRGRVHFYEGHGIGPTTLISRLAAKLGVDVLVLTNAAGGLDPAMAAGELMLIEDHLNFLGVNPLTGWRLPDGAPAFIPLSSVYDRDLLAAAEEAARACGITVSRGVYASLPGPSYETPAETRFLAGAGARAVGMSTVPESVAAVALGLRVLAISAITNVAGAADTHEHVLGVAKQAGRDLRAILSAVIPGMPTRPHPLDASGPRRGT